MLAFLELPTETPFSLPLNGTENTVWHAANLPIAGHYKRTPKSNQSSVRSSFWKLQIRVAVPSLHILISPCITPGVAQIPPVCFPSARLTCTLHHSLFCFFFVLQKWVFSYFLHAAILIVKCHWRISVPGLRHDSASGYLPSRMRLDFHDWPASHCCISTATS